MKWFQHDSDASYDAKIKKLILKHGTDGYAIYFHCLELIANTITQSNINFELEHDSEIIADNLKIKGNDKMSGIDIVNMIMRDIINVGLFTESNNRIFCYKLALRLDNTISRSPEINTIKEKVRINNVVTTKKLLPEKKRVKEIKEDKKKTDKIKYADTVYMLDSEYEKLVNKYGKHQTLRLIEKLDNYKGAKGKTYKSDYKAILSWVIESCHAKPEAEIMSKKEHERMKIQQQGNDSADPQTIKEILCNSKFADKVL